MEKVVKVITGPLDHIELTEEEKEEAMTERKIKKWRNQKHKDYWDAQEQDAIRRREEYNKQRRGQEIH